MFSEIKCIIFDCDGVLVDSESIGIQTLLDMAAKLGFKMQDHDAMVAFKGISLQNQFQFIENALERKLPDHFEAEYRIKSYQAFSDQLKPVAGAKEFANDLAVPFCVASNGPNDKIQLNLTITGLLPLFADRIFSAYDIGSWKPDPQIFLHAASEMGFLPSQCLVIDDSIVGVTAAINGGFPVIGFGSAPNTNFEQYIKWSKSFDHIRQLLPHNIFK